VENFRLKGALKFKFIKVKYKSETTKEQMSTSGIQAKVQEVKDMTRIERIGPQPAALSGERRVERVASGVQSEAYDERRSLTY